MRGEREEIEFNLSPSISIRGQVHTASIDHNLEQCNCCSETGGWMLEGPGEGVNNVSTVQSTPAFSCMTQFPSSSPLHLPPLRLCLLLTSPAPFTSFNQFTKIQRPKQHNSSFPPACCGLVCVYVCACEVSFPA